MERISTYDDRPYRRYVDPHPQRGARRAPHVEMPASKVKRGLAEVLKREGYIWDWRKSKPHPINQLRLELKYGPNGERVIRHIKRVSKPGRRVYSRADRTEAGPRTAWAFPSSAPAAA